MRGFHIFFTDLTFFKAANKKLDLHKTKGKSL